MGIFIAGRGKDREIFAKMSDKEKESTVNFYSQLYSFNLMYGKRCKNED
jgi:hypothetical protein